MADTERSLKVSSHPGPSLLKGSLLPLLQMEHENQQLKTANLKQTEQILLLQDKLQGEESHTR